jgi:hypothetical protein
MQYVAFVLRQLGMAAVLVPLTLTLCFWVCFTLVEMADGGVLVGVLFAATIWVLPFGLLLWGLGFSLSHGRRPKRLPR